MPLLENDLNNFVTYWNGHRMRADHLAVCPSGIPEDLYYLPSLYGIDYNLMCNA